MFRGGGWNSRGNETARQVQRRVVCGCPLVTQNRWRHSSTPQPVQPRVRGMHCAKAEGEKMRWDEFFLGVTGARKKQQGRIVQRERETWSEAGFYRTRPYGKACGVPGHTPIHPSTCGNTTFDTFTDSSGLLYQEKTQELCYPRISVHSDDNQPCFCVRHLYVPNTWPATTTSRVFVSATSTCPTLGLRNPGGGGLRARC